MANYDDRWHGEESHRWGREGGRRAHHHDDDAPRRFRDFGDERAYPYGWPEYDRDDFRGLYSGRREHTRRYGNETHRADDRGDMDWRGYSDYDRGRVVGHGRSFGRGFEPEHREHYGRGHEHERGWMEKASDEVASWFGDDDAQYRRHQDELRAENRGRGPRNYRRSDERILDDLNDRMTEDPWLDAGDIEVAVKDGEVTLNGMVDSRAAKRRAEDIADSVSAVRNVQNNLRVRDRGQHAASGIGTGGMGGGGMSGA